MLGLKRAPGLVIEFADEEHFSLAVGDIVIAGAASVALGRPQFGPTIGAVSGTVEAGRIDERLDQENRVAVAGLPVGGEPRAQQRPSVREAKLGHSTSGKKRVLLARKPSRQRRRSSDQPIQRSRCRRCLAGAAKSSRASQ